MRHLQQAEFERDLIISSIEPNRSLNASYELGQTLGPNSSLGTTTEGVDPDEQFDQAFEHAQVAIILMYTVLCVVAVLGNSCAVYVIISKRSMRKNVTNYFIASLAVSDILIGLVCIPFTFVANVLFNYWPFGSALCPIVTYLQVAVVFQNSYTMLAMSLERYIAIIHPFMRRLGKRRCLQVVALCWVLAFLTPLPTAILSRTSEIENTTVYLCEEKWGSEHQRFSYSMTIMVLQYFVPLAVLVYTYARIVRVIWLKELPTPAELLSQNGKSERKAKTKNQEPDPRKKIIKMMITVVSIYGICWLPLHAITIASDINNELVYAPYIRILWVAAHWIAMSSCAYNPFIYWWMNPKFHQGYLSMFQRMRGALCFLCERSGRKQSASSQSSRRVFSQFGNGSGDVPRLCRRQSNTQMVEFTSVYNDEHRKYDSLVLTDHGKDKSLTKGTDFIPELSKISEVTENGLSYYGRKSLCSENDDSSHVCRT